MILNKYLSFGSATATKHHYGPCTLVTEPEPCPDPNYIQVYLYTRKNNSTGQKVEFNETSDSFQESNFDPNRENKIIIHGFNTDIFLDVLQNIKTEYLKKDDLNVWMVNYPKLVSGSLCYMAAHHNIGHVGKCLVQMVMALRRHKSDRIHVIGFSLGAQVTNHIANHLEGDKLDRISGLDPAGPGFTFRSKRHRLDPSDAHFVDVIHTNGGLNGDLEQCGHIDFYMNGGISQPGCFESRDYLNCNHRRAPIYFAESINSKVGFLAWSCDGYITYLRGKCKPNLQLVSMGERCPQGSSGFHITYTASSPPFALGNWTSGYFKNVTNELLYFISNTLLRNTKEVQLMKNKETNNVQ